MHQRHLRYFVGIVDAGSFSRAATLIHVAQPALSQQIADLEQELGVTLLHRSARGVRPTPAGELLYKEASAILQQMDRLPDLLRSLGAAPQGVVRLGMSSTLASVLAGSLIETCRAQLPKVTLQFTAANSLQLRERLHAGSLDIALAFEDDDGANVNTGLHHLPLFRRRLSLIRRRGATGSDGGAGDDADQAAVSIETLAALPLVLAIRPNVTRTLLDRAFTARGLTPQIVAETELFSGMMSAVLAGVGVAAIPASDLSITPGHEALVAIPIEPPLFLTAAILAPGATPLTPAATAVRKVLAAFMRDYLSGLSCQDTVLVESTS
ncbi:LysR family transcriptional regulator [Cupriavidus agavae]|uniref:LysR family transcriptional regulator n=1 Tax=Cupriavidus agavae TaxID=1001822 RepID=A0A4Q7S2K1_9BURK|nr:LysR substrate-binding domain-containing protein [Cupriavidus agavae]RZT39152.1 LysR family transcriptional regulator [Cupriavidus agavae]